MDYTVFSTEFPDVKVSYNEPLKILHYKTGGRAAILLFPKIKEASAVMHYFVNIIFQRRLRKCIERDLLKTDM